MDKFWMISIGAVLGANARYWLADWVIQKWGGGFPLGTMLINLSGSFLLGLFLTLATERLPIDPRWRFMIAVGFLGSYTTFSTYTFESFDLIFKGQLMPGLANLFGSTLLGVLAVGAGIFLAKNL